MIPINDKLNLINEVDDELNTLISNKLLSTGVTNKVHDETMAIVANHINYIVDAFKKAIGSE